MMADRMSMASDIVGAGRSARSTISKWVPLLRSKKAEKYVILEAARLAKETSLSSALAHIEAIGTGAHKRAAYLLRANSASNLEEWAGHFNAYLQPFDLAPIRVAPSEPAEQSGRAPFFRLAADPGYQISAQDKVSVIMPAYNAEQTIAHAVHSILRQTWQNLELVVVDDASTDGTWRIVAEIAATDSRVKIMRNIDNVGPYVSKNAALSVITGEYFTGHDADDWAHPQRIERQIACLKSRPDYDATIAHWLRVTPDLQFDELSRSIVRSADGAAHRAMISCFFRTDAFRKKLGHWDCVRFGADRELYARAQLAMSGRFHESPVVAMLALDRETSLTRDPVHGTRLSTGVSSTRKRYRENWMAWHATLTPQTASLEFPHIDRKFTAPEAMVISESRLRQAAQDIPGPVN